MQGYLRPSAISSHYDQLSDGLKLLSAKVRSMGRQGVQDGHAHAAIF